MKYFVIVAFFLVLTASAYAMGGAGPWQYNGALVGPTDKGLNYMGSYLVDDGQGGIVIFWNSVSPTVSWECNARRVGRDGATIWEKTIAPNPSFYWGDEKYRIATRTPDGNLIVSYLDKSRDTARKPGDQADDGGTGEVYVKKINMTNGATIWGPVLASAAYGSAWRQGLETDGQGGIFVTFHVNSDKYSYYLQYVTAEGASRFPGDGLLLVNSSYQMDNGTMISDGSHGAWFVWDQEDKKILAKHIINNPGGISFGPTIEVCAVTGKGKFQSFAYKEICSDGDGGFVAAWLDHRGGSINDIYAQRIGKDGNAVWTADGVPVSQVALINKDMPQALLDGNSVIILWAMPDATGTKNDVYGKKLSLSNAAVDPAWAAAGSGGKKLTNDGTSFSYNALLDNAGGLFLSFATGRNETYAKLVPFVTAISNGDLNSLDFSTNIDIYGQHLNGNGDPLWPQDIPICRAPDCQGVLLFESLIPNYTEQWFFTVWPDARYSPGIGAAGLFSQINMAAKVTDVSSPEISVLTVNGSTYVRGMNVINGVNINGHVQVTNSTLDLPYATIEVSWDGASYEAVNIASGSSTQSEFSFNKVLPDGAHRFVVYAADNYGNSATFEGLVAASATTPIIDQIKFDDQSYRSGDYISAVPTVKGRIRTQTAAFSTAGSNLKITFSKLGFSNTENIINVSLVDSATGTFEHTAAAALPEDGEYAFSLSGSDIYGHTGTFEGTVKLGAGSSAIKDVIAYGQSTQAPWKFSPQKEALVFSYQLSRSIDIMISLMSTDGRNVYNRLIKSGEAGASLGTNSFSWDGTSDFGGKVGNGIYLLRIMSGKNILYKGAIVVND